MSESDRKLQNYSLDELRSDFDLCCRLRGLKVIILFVDGTLTHGYLVNILPDLGQVILRDKVENRDRRVRINADQLKCILVDEKDRL